MTVRPALIGLALLLCGCSQLKRIETYRVCDLTAREVKCWINEKEYPPDDCIIQDRPGMLPYQLWLCGPYSILFPVPR